MTPSPPLLALDLLVVGGLTIDRFADGTSASGGTAMHVVRSVEPRGLRLGVMTSAGPEPEAERGLAELRRRCAFLESTAHRATPTFRHFEEPTGRRLWLECVGGPVIMDRFDAERVSFGAVLYAPIAGEIPLASLAAGGNPVPRAGILQGWLRTTDEGADVRPLSLASLDPAVVAELGTFDLLVASREDLVADAADPERQLSALRSAFGDGPALIVTNATDGLWLDEGGAREHVPAPWIVEGAPTVGAGDILAAFLMLPGAAGSWASRARTAMRVVAEDLEARKQR
jgi:hypothetical protein